MRFITSMLATAALAIFPAAAQALPDTTINSGPGSAGPTTYYSGTQATYNFSANEASTFECRFGKATLNDPAWESCTSPATFNTPTDGIYKFQVRATSGSGTETAYETRYFMVDRTAPVAWVGGGTFGTTTPTIGLSSSEQWGVTTYVCSIDGGAYGSCGTQEMFTVTLGPLAEGTHTVAVKATDAAGNVQVTPTVSEVIVDLTAPVVHLIEGPPATTTDTSAKFQFGSNEDLFGPDFECLLDGEKPEWWDWCSTQTYKGLSVGPHVIQVWGRDDAGNKSQMFEYRWEVLPSAAPPAPPVPPVPGPSPVKKATYLPATPAAKLRKALKKCVRLPAKAERKCKTQAKRLQFGAVQFKLDAPTPVKVKIARANGMSIAEIPVAGVKGTNQAALGERLLKGSYVATLAVEGKQDATLSFRVR